MIYAIRAVGTNFIKFGVAAEANLQERLRALQTGCPFPLEFAAIGLGSYKEEHQIHRMLKAADKHHAGEWFTMCLEVEQVIQWISDRSKAFPELPPLQRGVKRHRLARMTEHALELTAALEKANYNPRGQGRKTARRTVKHKGFDIPVLADRTKLRKAERIAWWAERTADGRQERNAR